MQNNYAMNQCTTPMQLQVQNTLRLLWLEHVLWTRSFLVSTAFGLNDLEYVTNRLLRNPIDFANILRPLYGNQTAEEFQKLLTEHLLIAARLVNAAKAGDRTIAQEQRIKWYTNADDIAEFLSDINPNWDAKTWQAMLYEHLKMTEEEALQLLNGQYAASITQYDAIEQQALKMADEMARGVIKQFQIR